MQLNKIMSATEACKRSGRGLFVSHDAGNGLQFERQRERLFLGLLFAGHSTETK